MTNNQRLLTSQDAKIIKPTVEPTNALHQTCEELVHYFDSSVFRPVGTTTTATATATASQMTAAVLTSQHKGVFEGTEPEDQCGMALLKIDSINYISEVRMMCVCQMRILFTPDNLMG